MSLYVSYLQRRHIIGGAIQLSAHRDLSGGPRNVRVAATQYVPKEIKTCETRVRSARNTSRYGGRRRPSAHRPHASLPRWFTRPGGGTEHERQSTLRGCQDPNRALDMQGAENTCLSGNAFRVEVVAEASLNAPHRARWESTSGMLTHLRGPSSAAPPWHAKSTAHERARRDNVCGI